jgi:type IV secretion system protein VirB10
MNGVDAQGYSGTKGKVDEHLFQYVKAAGIISAFTIVNGEFAQAVAGTTNQSLQNLMTANQGVVNQLGANIIDRTLNIQPTLTVKSGTKINIMLNKNIQLPPLEDYPVKKAYKRK